LGGLKEPCIRWGPDPSTGRGNLREEGHPVIKVYGHSVVSCAKTAELIQVPFGILGPRKHVLSRDVGCTLAQSDEYH